jgi:hypothetical protein
LCINVLFWHRIIGKFALHENIHSRAVLASVSRRVGQRGVVNKDERGRDVRGRGRVASASTR